MTISRWRSSFISKLKPPVAHVEGAIDERCPRCGLSPAPSHQSKASHKEVAMDVLGGCLLVFILFMVGARTEHWMEDAGHRFVDHIVWRESIERW